jgi:hypothetical protein
VVDSRNKTVGITEALKSVVIDEATECSEGLDNEWMKTQSLKNHAMVVADNLGRRSGGRERGIPESAAK